MFGAGLLLILGGVIIAAGPILQIRNARQARLLGEDPPEGGVGARGGLNLLTGIALIVLGLVAWIGGSTVAGE